MKTTRLLIATAATLAALTSTAQALTLQTTTPPTRPWQAWTNESQMPMAPMPVTFGEYHGPLPGCGPGNAGCETETETDDTLGNIVSRTFTISLLVNAPPVDLRHYLWHEETHVYDGAVMTNYYRAQFMAAWDLPGTPDDWWRTIPHTDGGSAGEWFAEAGALCDKYGLNLAHLDLPRTGDWTAYNFPGWERMITLERSCQIIVAAGQAAGLPVPTQRTYTPVRAARHSRTHPKPSGIVSGRG